jgi:signal transduction histidine kinase
MKRYVVLLTTILFLSQPALADEHATHREAEAMVIKAVKAISADRNGTLKAITAKDKQWVSGDLYPVVYNMNGKCLAHGQNPQKVGKDLMDQVDANGWKFVKERVALAKSQGKFWQDYKFTDPETGKVLPKSTYCEKTGDVIVCAGVYKR